MAKKRVGRPPGRGPNVRNVSFKIDPRDYKTIVALAKQQGTTASEIMRAALASLARAEDAGARVDYERARLEYAEFLKKIRERLDGKLQELQELK